MLIDKFAGLRNDIPTERFEPGELQTAVNVLVDDSLRIARRPGVTQQLAGNMHSLWSDGDTCLYVSEGTLYQLGADLATATPLRTGLSDLPMSYASAGTWVFYCNGLESGVVEEGQSRQWGIKPPPAFPATDAPGFLDPGTYQYTMTYIRDDGSESGAEAATSIEITQGGLSFPDLPVSDDPGVTMKVLYMTTANGAMLYEVTAIGNEITTISIEDAGETTPMDTLHLCPPPEGAHLVVEYLGHILVAAGQLLYHSQAYGLELFDALDYMVLDGPITLLAPTDNGLFVGTDKSQGVISGRTPTEFSYTETADYGVIPGSLAYAPGHLMGFEGIGETLVPIWYSRKGICVGMPGGAMYNLTDPKYQHPDTPDRAAGGVIKVDGSTYYIASS